MTTESKNLRQGILNHTVKGRYLSEDLTNGLKLKSLGGPTLRVTVENNTISVNGAKVVAPNQIAGNGVVHTINKVIR